MQEERWSDLLVQVTSRRPIYLADPMLCLSPSGASLIGALVRHADIWLAAEVLGIIEGAALYQREPELLGIEARHWEAARQALPRLSHLRDDAEKFHWIRDSVRDSCLPPGTDARLVGSWEAAAQALDGRVYKAEGNGLPVVAAWRDIAALAAVLPGAVVLCLRDEPGPAGRPPALCRRLDHWGVPCRHIPVENPLVASECRRLLHTIATAGAGMYLWSGLRLAALHVMMPADLRAPNGHTHGAGECRHQRRAPCPWDGAQAFWYDITEDPYAWN